MDVLVKHSRVGDIYDKVVAGKRIDDEDCLRLYREPDINSVGAIANVVRKRKNGNRATFVHNRYINYSNICILSCDFCAFGRKKRDEGAFEYSVDEIVAMAKEAVGQGVTEIHMVGGLHPSLPFSYYTNLLGSLKALDGNLHIKAFTAVEILHLGRRARKDVKSTLQTLRDAGLGSLTGGGAEILNPKIRREICRGKESPEEWLDVHRIWHRMGQRSTATMLYGHIETLEDRVEHLRRLRELQDETGGFLSFVPYAYEPENTPMEKKHHIERVGAAEDLRNIAVGRIYLDNFDHLTAYWIAHGLRVAQVALGYGADDLHGTIIEEKIFRMAGSKTPQRVACEELIVAIREAGREPLQRNSLFEIIESPASASVSPARVPVHSGRVGRSRARARLASVPYLNAKPLIWGIEDHLSYLEPSKMAEQLCRGEIDGGLVPIVECFEHDGYEIVDDVAIASVGPVQSVFLAYDPPIEKIVEVAADPASRASAALLPILLKEQYGISPRIVPLQGDDGSFQEQVSEGRSACLLIGDRALKFLWAGHAHHILDLASAWYDLTGLPFVFAVWALRRTTDTNAVAAMLRRAKEEGLVHLEEIIAKHPADRRDFLRAYFTRHVIYNLGDEEKSAIEKFRGYLRAAGKTKSDHRLRYV